MLSVLSATYVGKEKREMKLKPALNILICFMLLYFSVGGGGQC